MKSKEEIERLATRHYRSNGSGGGQYTEGLQEGRLIGYVDGYTQCQEDMARKEIQPEDIWNKESQDKIKEHILNHANNQSSKDILETELAARKYAEEDMADKKYTEEDMYNCWQTAFTDAMNITKKDYKSNWYSDFINSLNKQD